MERAEIYSGIKKALNEKAGFAMGKLGYAEQCLISIPAILSGNGKDVQKKAFWQLVTYHAKFQAGIYPPDPEFLSTYSLHLCNACKSLDVIGWFESTYEKTIKDILPEFRERKTSFRNTEPPLETDLNCYLQLFKGRKILIVNPVSSLMAQRLNKEVYEKVWDKYKKKWFEPEQVTFIEFPYSYYPAHNERLVWGNESEMIQKLLEKIGNSDFEIALIGAGAKGIPLAAGIKEMGKIGLSIGGHLQVITGIKGKRWERDPFYAEKIINDSWIRIPEHLVPPNSENLTDDSSYW